MTTATDSTAPGLLRFNCGALDQALALVDAHGAPGAPSYAGPVGSHLRHVIEHYEALLFPAHAGEVDYDSRARDAELERSPAVARARLGALRQELVLAVDDSLDETLVVRGRCGSFGELEFTVVSSFGRELAFVASHAVHHFALLRAHCLQQGIAIGADFGKAAATIAHERALESSSHLKDSLPCKHPQLPA